MTVRTQVRFSLKEYAPREVNGEFVPSPMINLETHSELPGLPSGTFTLDFYPKITWERAQEIRDTLNATFSEFSFTPDSPVTTPTPPGIH